MKDKCKHCDGIGYIEHVGEDLYEACEHCHSEKLVEKVSWHQMINHEIMSEMYNKIREEYQRLIVAKK